MKFLLLFLVFSIPGLPLRAQDPPPSWADSELPARVREALPSPVLVRRAAQERSGARQLRPSRKAKTDTPEGAANVDNAMRVMLLAAGAVIFVALCLLILRRARGKRRSKTPAGEDSIAVRGDPAGSAVPNGVRALHRRSLQHLRRLGLLGSREAPPDGRILGRIGDHPAGAPFRVVSTLFSRVVYGGREANPEDLDLARTAQDDLAAMRSATERQL